MSLRQETLQTKINLLHFLFRNKVSPRRIREHTQQWLLMLVLVTCLGELLILFSSKSSHSLVRPLTKRLSCEALSHAQVVWLNQRWKRPKNLSSNIYLIWKEMPRKKKHSLESLSKYLKKILGKTWSRSHWWRQLRPCLLQTTCLRMDWCHAWWKSMLCVSLSAINVKLLPNWLPVLVYLLTCWASRTRPSSLKVLEVCFSSCTMFIQRLDSWQLRNFTLFSWFWKIILSWSQKVMKINTTLLSRCSVRLIGHSL